MKTMNEIYGDGSKHHCCNECGFCLDCGDCQCWQIKKDRIDGSNEVCLETRNIAEEDNKQEHKSVDVDNQSTDTDPLTNPLPSNSDEVSRIDGGRINNLKSKKGWGRSYGYKDKSKAYTDAKESLSRLRSRN